MTIVIPKPKAEYTYAANGTLWDEKHSTARDYLKDQKDSVRRNPRSTLVSAWRPPLPYAREIWSENSGTCSFSASLVWWGGDGVWSGNYSGSINESSYLDTVPPLPTGLVQQAEVRALTQLKRQNVNYGVALGERAQTARLVGSTLTRLTEAVRAAKQLNLYRALYALGLRTPRNQRKLEGAFDLWLELQYGWKPLLSDVYGAVSDLNAKEEQRGRVAVTVKGHAQAKETVDKTVTDVIGPHYLDVTKRSDIEHKVFVRLDYVQDDTPYSTLAQLGITNPLAIAWELVPWSFVADWFVPIGTYLNILDATNGWSFRGGSCSMKTTAKSRPVKASHRSSYPPWPTIGSASASGNCRQMRFERAVYSSSPTPDLQFLRLKTNTSNVHVANGIALLMSAITGGTRVR